MVKEDNKGDKIIISRGCSLQETKRYIDVLELGIPTKGFKILNKL